MRIGIIGGIFSKPAEYRDAVSITPETVLVEGLRARGHDVAALSHRSALDLRTYDIVHVHHLGVGALRVAGSLTPARLVFTPHGWTPSTRVRRTAERLVLSRADAVVALSSSEQDRLRVPAGRDAMISVIPNGIPPESFPFSQPAPPEDEPWRVLYVGQLVTRKGVDVLLRALSELTGRYSSSLELVYQVSTEEDRLRELARDLGIADSVEFLGMQKASDVSSHYTRSHLVVLPSYSEALPSVVTEAMLTGRPVVATAVGGVREQMGGFGSVVESRSVDALRRGLASVIDNYSEHCRRAGGMRDWAVQRYSVHAMVAGHERLYEALLTNADGARRRRIRNIAGTMAIGGAARAWMTLRAF